MAPAYKSICPQLGILQAPRGQGPTAPNHTGPGTISQNPSLKFYIHRFCTKPSASLFHLCSQGAGPNQIPLPLELLHFGHTENLQAHWKCHSRCGLTAYCNPTPYHPFPCPLCLSHIVFPSSSHLQLLPRRLFPQPFHQLGAAPASHLSFKFSPLETSLTTLSKPGVFSTYYHVLSSFKQSTYLSPVLQIRSPGLGGPLLRVMKVWGCILQSSSEAQEPPVNSLVVALFSSLLLKAQSPCFLAGYWQGAILSSWMSSIPCQVVLCTT